MYACGPTVYRYAHLGNLRTLHALRPDPSRARARRLPRHADHEHHRRRAHDRRSSPEAVDKMLLAVEDEGLAPARDRREVHARPCSRTPRRSASRPPDRYPKATEHIPEMIEITRDARRTGPRLRRGLRQRVLRRHLVPGLRQAQRQHAGQAPGGPSRPRDRPGASGTRPTSRCGRRRAPAGS